MAELDNRQTVGVVVVLAVVAGIAYGLERNQKSRKTNTLAPDTLPYYGPPLGEAVTDTQVQALFPVIPPAIISAATNRDHWPNRGRAYTVNVPSIVNQTAGKVTVQNGVVIANAG